MRHRRLLFLLFVLSCAVLRSSTYHSFVSDANTRSKRQLSKGNEAEPFGSRNSLALGYSTSRRRWIEQRAYLENLGTRESTRTSQVYTGELTTQRPFLEGGCEQINGLDVCQSLTHRQKPRVNITVSTGSWLSAELNMGERDCAASSCFLSVDRGHSEDSHIFLDSLHPEGVYPAKVRAAQVTVVVDLEANRTRVNSKATRFDWLASHRRGDQPMASFVPLSYINTDVAKFKTQGAPYTMRRRAIPILVSNCNANVDRNGFVKRLGNFLTIEQFGDCDLEGAIKVDISDVHPSCASQSRRSAMWDAQKECILFSSLFGLVIENTFEDGYVTEKLWQVLKVGAIPVVIGNPELYEPYLPAPEAAIFLDQFSSYKKGASYLKLLMRNPGRWRKHVEWKNKAFSNNFLRLAHHSFATLACDLCDKYVIDADDLSVDDTPGVDIVIPCAMHLLSQGRIPSHSSRINYVFGFDAVFITHYTPLSSRKTEMIERVQSQLGIVPTFVEDFDREALTDEHFECFSDRTAQQAYIYRHTTRGEDSLSLKHMAIYYHIVRNSFQNVLVLEDDAMFVHPDWRSNNSIWQKILRDLPHDYDVLFLSGCCDIHEVGTKVTEHLYFAQESRVSSMYMISQKGARNLLRSLPLVAPIDFHMNYAAMNMTKWHDLTGIERGPRTQNIKFYHTEPYLSEQIVPEGSTGRTVMDA